MTRLKAREPNRGPSLSAAVPPADRLRGLMVRPWFGPAVVAVVAWLAVVATIGPTGRGPGLTCDEYYDAAAGKQLIRALRTEGFGFFNFDRIDKNYGALTLHPPLGRWLLGLAHMPFDVLPEQPLSVWMPGARLGAASAFAVLVLIVGVATARLTGALPGTVAAAALLLTPRAFAHGHIASLDTFQVLTCFAAIWSLSWSTETESPDARRFALAGLFWGLAMLTKINGLLLLPTTVVWIAWIYRRKAIAPIANWFVTGSLVFVVGWPWLWVAPWSRLEKFLMSSTDRQSLHNFYAGRVWSDIDTPWHYPWVMTAVTIPIGFLILGLLGAFWKSASERVRRFRQLVVLNLGFVLAVFSLPRTPVYDGERLFLIAYPLWAVLVGFGAAAVSAWPRWQRMSRPVTVGVVALFLATQSVGLALYHPFQLSYYNLLVGGLRGANRLGFETTYWGDTIDHGLIAQTTRHAAARQVYYAPQLAPFQAVATQIAFPQLLQNAIQLVGWDQGSPDAVKNLSGNYVLIYNRRAEELGLEPILKQGEIVAENSRQGVWLARLYRMPGREIKTATKAAK